MAVKKTMQLFLCSMQILLLDSFIFFTFKEEATAYDNDSLGIFE